MSSTPKQQASSGVAWLTSSAGMTAASRPTMLAAGSRQGALGCRRGSSSSSSCRPRFTRCGMRPACAAGTAQQAAGDVVIRRRPTADAPTPSNILEEIVWYKDVEISGWRAQQPLAAVQELAAKAPPSRDFKAAILAKAQQTGKPGLIAEVKKASPSKGVIQPNFNAVAIAQGYEAGGAACLSVLTDEKFFQGGFGNLAAIRGAGVSCPLLCKEFIVDDYQVYKARAAGADAFLLIAAVLSNEELAHFLALGGQLGMACLVEVHTEGELSRVLSLPGVDAGHVLLGINNRDLGTFKVDLGLTRRIMESGPGREVAARGILMVGESGIFTPDDVAFVQAAGVGAILVGESIVKNADPESGVKQLLSLA